MMVLVTLYALMFSLLRISEALLGETMPAAYLVLGLFAGAVLVGQMVLFGGKEPRLASCLVGACAMPVLYVGVMAYADGAMWLERLRANPMDVFELVGSLLCTIIGAAIPGWLCGYIIGTVCAGVFLIMDRNWNAGQIEDDQPIDAEIVSTDEPQQDRSLSNTSNDEDPWSRD
jgi:hypothetical protein